MFPRWLPLYLLAIAALTLFPFSAPECPRPGWVLQMARFDFVANLLAFVPIGMALYRSPAWRTLLLAFALSLTIELCQRWLPRQQDVSDLVSNTLGAGLGWWIANLWLSRWPGPLLRPVTRRLLVWGAAAVLLVAVGTRAVRSAPHDFSNWANLPLAIGNSAYGDRPWMGELSELALYDRALEGTEHLPPLQLDGSPPLWSAGGPILWIRFGGESAAARVDGPDGPVRFSPDISGATTLSTSGLMLLPSGLALETWVSDHVNERLRRAGRMTLDLRLRSHVLNQFGPARIVDIGDGGKRWNFMLAQRGSSYISRFRTPSASANARIVEVYSPPQKVNLSDQRVRMIYDGTRSSIWIDGRCEDDNTTAISASSPLIGSLLGLSIVVCTALGALSLAALSTQRVLRLPLAFTGGLLSWLVLQSLGAWSHLSGFQGGAAFLGLAAIAACVPILLRRS